MKEQKSVKKQAGFTRPVTHLSAVYRSQDGHDHHAGHDEDCKDHTAQEHLIKFLIVSGSVLIILSDGKNAENAHKDDQSGDDERSANMLSRPERKESLTGIEQEDHDAQYFKDRFAVEILFHKSPSFLFLILPWICG